MYADTTGSSGRYVHATTSWLVISDSTISLDGWLYAVEQIFDDRLILFCKDPGYAVRDTLIAVGIGEARGRIFK